MLELMDKIICAKNNCQKQKKTKLFNNSNKLNQCLSWANSRNLATYFQKIREKKNMKTLRHFTK